MKARVAKKNRAATRPERMIAVSKGAPGLGVIPDGNDGEAFRIKVEFAGIEFFSVWADSKGAAKHFLRRTVNEFHLAEAAKQAGVDPQHMWDFEKL